MSDDEGGRGLSAEEEVLQRHRREKKELQAKIQQLKKTVNRDKKKKKEVLEEIDNLEKEMKGRHEEELEALQEPQDKVSEVAEGITGVALENGEDEEHQAGSLLQETHEEKAGEKKMSKAEKRRQKKAEANREREARIKAEEAESKNSARSVEAEKLKALLRERKLKMHEIEPDGNCMYAAIAHQAGQDTTVASLRSQAEQFIRTNYSEFAPFITDPKTGEMLTPEQFSEYCDLIIKTPAWGGQPELRALSQVLQRRIEVLQAEGSPIVFGESWTQHKTILLAYYRHYYGLGEHYNSVTALNVEALSKKHGRFSRDT